MTYVPTKKRPSQTTVHKIADIRAEAEKDGAENNHEVALWAIDHSVYWRSEGYAAIISNLEEFDHEDETNN